MPRFAFLRLWGWLFLLPPRDAFGEKAGTPTAFGRSKRCEDRLTRASGGDAWHLREDVEFAEDLAVRYMDARVGRHPGNTGRAATRRVMIQLQRLATRSRSARPITSRRSEVAPVLWPPQPRHRSRSHRPVSSALCLVAMLLAGWLRPPLSARGKHDCSLAMALFCSLAFGVGGLLLGEQWSLTAEASALAPGI